MFTLPSGTTIINIDENDTDFPTGAIQTQGTNPTTVVSSTATTTAVTTPSGFFSDTDTDGDGHIDLVEIQNGTNPK